MCSPIYFLCQIEKALGIILCSAFFQIRARRDLLAMRKMSDSSLRRTNSGNGGSVPSESQFVARKLLLLSASAIPAVEWPFHPCGWR
mmetsp:Transcript_2458/g.5079  ORF Transcript_2458/g.5079 Transcript_2458/m.5079 type:complete len:87 (+) Transcript_2458:722-982(+)